MRRPCALAGRDRTQVGARVGHFTARAVQDPVQHRRPRAGGVVQLSKENVIGAGVSHPQERACGRMHEMPRFLAALGAGFAVDPEPVRAERLIGQRWRQGIASRSGAGAMRWQ